MLESENTRLGRELVELQGRLAVGERVEKEGRREALGLRQKLLKGEASMEALRQEVTKQVGGLHELGRVLGGSWAVLYPLSSLQWKQVGTPIMEPFFKTTSEDLSLSPTP